MPQAELALGHVQVDASVNHSPVRALRVIHVEEADLPAVLRHEAFETGNKVTEPHAGGRVLV